MIFKKIVYTYIFVCACLLILPGVAFSKMQSSNYQIDFDSINTGGNVSTSSNYQISDTAGEIATGDSDSTNYKMRAGYQQVDTSAYIALSGLTSETLPSISGVISAVSATSTSVLVTTDNSAGYQLTIQASTTPALKSGSFSFDDYVPVGTSTDYVFVEDASTSLFGFSVQGADAHTEFLNNGSACGVGSTSTIQRCWRGFDTTPILISEKNSANHPTGVVTNIYYQASNGANHFQEPGVYQADITLTAVAL